MNPILPISLIASGLVEPPHAIVVSSCAKVEMPSMFFLVTCCADTPRPSAQPRPRRPAQPWLSE